MQDSEPTPANKPLSIHEMLRIMDVATTLRRERERASQQLDHNATVAQLRERLLATAEATGEQVTPAEVEVAIERYFETQHEYRDPPRSLRVWLAHLYIRRRPITVLAAGFAALFFGVWWLASSTASPFSSAGRIERRTTEATAEFDRQRALARAVAVSPEAIAALDELVAEGDRHRASAVADPLEQVVQRLRALTATLREEFAVRVVSRPGQDSGVWRKTEEGQLSGYYLIVEARDPSGVALRRTVRNAEDSGRMVTVQSWGEMVPKAVYDRVGADKKADGIIDDSLFAEKLRGHLDLTMRMRGAGDDALPRRRQIVMSDDR